MVEAWGRVVPGPPDVASILAAGGTLAGGGVAADVGAAVGRAARSGRTDCRGHSGGETAHRSLAVCQLRGSWCIELEL